MQEFVRPLPLSSSTLFQKWKAGILPINWNSLKFSRGGSSFFIQAWSWFAEEAGSSQYKWKAQPTQPRDRMNSGL